ncbi:MAG: 4-deoxy-4-formamido-L-arabinose-phosphoundecaprenol deformylase [Gammaproteobacteria bacterium]|nr:4-deoxy-4-formamido-L-arabinose-phosphoundecaprenol deformylase [Gammaproteobacteria bacterium]
MSDSSTRVGLRIDVDTFRGTRNGVPRLLEIFAHHNIHATFFFSVGPDNMGRHLWRLFKPAFLIKMLRSNAASLYGWDILLAGTFWPGRNIGKALGEIILATEQAGHEVGLHAWDHHKWQKQVEDMSGQQSRQEIQKGFDSLSRILAHKPACSAAAGWKCTEQVLLEKDKFGFQYNSDCRGRSIFRPVVDGQVCAPQIPVTLPTYDEMIGRDGVTNENYNDRLLAMIVPGQFNVLTIHAEVEGIICAGMFEQFLQRAHERHISFVPLRELLPPPEAIPQGRIELGNLAGREGTMCLQAT